MSETKLEQKIEQLIDCSNNQQIQLNRIEDKLVKHIENQDKMFSGVTLALLDLSKKINNENN